MSIMDVVPPHPGSRTAGLQCTHTEAETELGVLSPRRARVLGEHPACANSREHEGAEGLGGLACRLHLG